MPITERWIIIMNEVYVGYDVLGKNAKFVSSAGQYIGLSRGHYNGLIN